MKNLKVVDVVLWVLVLLGFFGALKISYANFNGQFCPYVGPVPICYVVLFGYGMMIAALLVPSNALKHYFFCIGWGIAFLIALAGSAAEIFTEGGGVCPTTGGGSLRGGAAASGTIPMCYLSLAFTVVILILFLIGPYKRACDAHNANAAA